MSLDRNLSKILIVDFGSQFTQLIARRIREIGVFSEIISHKKVKIKDIDHTVKGIILSGGPLNVYEINKTYFPVLDSMIASMNEHDDAKIQIFSHASSTSTSQYNMKLSQKRMNKVISYFNVNGIDLTRMTYKAYGESKLLNRCENDQECEDAMHQINRRTELRIIQENED